MAIFLFCVINYKFYDVDVFSMNEELLCGTRRVCLVIDSKEKQFERFESLCQERGIPVLRRDLPSGDYLWLLLPSGAKADYSLDKYDLEQVVIFLHFQILIERL